MLPGSRSNSGGLKLHRAVHPQPFCGGVSVGDKNMLFKLGTATFVVILLSLDAASAVK